MGRAAVVMVLRMVAQSSVLLSCFATIATAQQARIYSGEHASFSRIVIEMGAALTWRITPAPDGYGIAFDPPLTRMDLSPVFERIPRTRITDIRQLSTGGDLILSSSCDCHVEAFAVSSDTIAIDIKDGPGPALKAAPQPAPGAALPPGLTIALTQPQAEGAPTRDDDPSTMASPVSTSVLAIPQSRIDGAIQDQPVRPAPLPIVAPAVLERQIAESRLAEGLADSLGRDLRRAAASGLVDLVDPDRAGTASSLTPNREGISLPGPTRNRRNIDIRTAYDRLIAPRAVEDQELRRCPDPAFFDFLTDAQPHADLSALPQLRMNLVDARGMVRPEGAFDLMQAYFVLGFGAEGRVLARAANLNDETLATYEGLSRILDKRGDTDTETWAGWQRCESPVALWALLGSDPRTRARGLDVGAVQRAFFDLPAHLRLHLGPELAERLTRAGLPDAAAAIENRIEDLVAPPAPSVSSAEDETTLPRPDQTGPVISAGSPERDVNDLLDRFERQMREGRTVESRDIDLAASLVREHEGSEIGRKLVSATALGHLERNEIEAALSVLEDSLLPDDRDWNTLLRRAVGRTVMTKNDADLLLLALHPRGKDVIALLTTDQKLSSADRLTDLGFPSVALSLMENEDSARGTRAEITLAKATLANGDAARALAILAGRMDTAANEIRAAAHMDLGNHALAAAAFAAINATDDAARAAWLSGDATVIARFGTPEQLALADDIAAFPIEAAVTPSNGAAPQGVPAGLGSDLVAPSPITTPSPGGIDAGQRIEAPSLAQARALAERSQALRAGLSRVLEGEGPSP